MHMLALRIGKMEFNCKSHLLFVTDEHRSGDLGEVLQLLRVVLLQL